MNEHSNNAVLTEHIILTKTRANSLNDVKTLNMWGFNLKDITIFERMPNIEICSLAVNQISDISPLAFCRKLRELYLRQNAISDFKQLTYLQDLRHLRILSLSGNPIAESPNYRQIILKALPNLEKLDDISASQVVAPPPEPQSQAQNIQKFTSPAQGQDHYKVNHQRRQSYDDNQRYQQQRPTKNKTNVNTRSDESALTAILALLPELSPDSLSIVLQAICDLSKRNE